MSFSVLEQTTSSNDRSDAYTSLVDSLLQYAVALCRNNNYAEASSILKNALKQSNNHDYQKSAKYWVLRAEIAEKLNDKNQIISCFETAAKYKAKPFTAVINAFTAFKLRDASSHIQQQPQPQQQPQHQPQQQQQQQQQQHPNNNSDDKTIAVDVSNNHTHHSSMSISDAASISVSDNNSDCEREQNTAHDNNNDNHNTRMVPSTPEEALDASPTCSLLLYSEDSEMNKNRNHHNNNNNNNHATKNINNNNNYANDSSSLAMMEKGSITTMGHVSNNNNNNNNNDSNSSGSCKNNNKFTKKSFLVSPQKFAVPSTPLTNDLENFVKRLRHKKYTFRSKHKQPAQKQQQKQLSQQQQQQQQQQQHKHQNPNNIANTNTNTNTNRNTSVNNADQNTKNSNDNNSFSYMYHNMLSPITDITSESSAFSSNKNTNTNTNTNTNRNRKTRTTNTNTNTNTNANHLTADPFVLSYDTSFMSDSVTTPMKSISNTNTNTNTIADNTYSSSSTNTHKHNNASANLFLIESPFAGLIDNSSNFQSPLFPKSRSKTRDHKQPKNNDGQNNKAAHNVGKYNLSVKTKANTTTNLNSSLLSMAPERTPVQFNSDSDSESAEPTESNLLNISQSIKELSLIPSNDDGNHSDHHDDHNNNNNKENMHRNNNNNNNNNHRNSGVKSPFVPRSILKNHKTKSLSTTNNSSEDDEEEDDDVGASFVKLALLEVTNAKKKKYGSARIVSPVRRSKRLAHKRSEREVQNDQPVQQREQQSILNKNNKNNHGYHEILAQNKADITAMLRASNYTYIANPMLSPVAGNKQKQFYLK